MKLPSSINHLPYLNRLRGAYHRLQDHLGVPRGLVLPAENAQCILTLIEKFRPIQTEYPLIRIGPNGDGGYLVPDDLASIQACYSPGVSSTIGFDLDCAVRGMSVFLADASVNGLPEEHPGLSFTKKFLSCWEDDAHMTIDSWVHSTLPDDPDSDLMLQMDIEGGEYQVLSSMSDALLSRFRILVIEFHFLDHLWNPGFFFLVQPLFNRLLKNHYCVHLHPNNCCGSLARGDIEVPRVMEFTFLRKDRVVKPLRSPSPYPHPDDYDNTPSSPLVLPPCWR
jgi:hypothetical protein